MRWLDSFFELQWNHRLVFRLRKLRIWIRNMFCMAWYFVRKFYFSAFSFPLGIFFLEVGVYYMFKHEWEQFVMEEWRQEASLFLFTVLVSTFFYYLTVSAPRRARLFEVKFYFRQLYRVRKIEFLEDLLWIVNRDDVGAFNRELGRYSSGSDFDALMEPKIFKMFFSSGGEYRWAQEEKDMRNWDLICTAIERSEENFQLVLRHLGLINDDLNRFFFAAGGMKRGAYGGMINFQLEYGRWLRADRLDYDGMKPRYRFLYSLFAAWNFLEEDMGRDYVERALEGGK